MAQRKTVSKKTNAAKSQRQDDPTSGRLNRPADIVLTNTQVSIQGSTIRFIGSRGNTLATFSSSTSKLTVNGKLVVDNLDIVGKLNNLDARLKKLES